MSAKDFDLRLATYELREGRGMYENLTIRAGYRGEERVVPPAGEEHAFTRTCYERRVEISVSPTGRSVRVFVDGEEIR